MKFKCDECGAPTDNDQSWDLETLYTEGKPRRIEVHRCDKCEERFHRKIDWQSEGEAWNECTIICPYCGYEYEEYDAYAFEDGTHEEVECDGCGRKFDLEVETRREFSTKRSLCEMPDDYEGSEE